MAKLPGELAFIKPFLVRALQMQQASPLISYYTHRYATQMVLDFYKENPDNIQVRTYLNQLMDQMEAKKQTIGEHPDPKGQFQTFVTSLFVKADSEDRKQGATKQTAHVFLVCSYFIQAMSTFDELPPDWQEKRIYCKWKANDIAKALKEGRSPLPGGPKEQAENNEGLPVIQPPAQVGFQNQSSFPPIESFQPPQNSFVPPSGNFQQPQSSYYEPQPFVQVQAPVQHQPPMPQKAFPTGGNVSAKDRRVGIQTAKKHAKMAISELDYKNVEQARQNLEAALNSLANL